jgi:hypothetical protein
MARCRWCKRPFRPRPGGRPALFCKPACRQRAYEKRKWTPYSETDALALVLLPAAALRRLVARVRHQHMVELLKSGAVPLVDPAQIDGVLDSMAKPQDRRAVAPHAAAEQVSRRLVRNLVLLGRCGAGRRPPGRRRRRVAQNRGRTPAMTVRVLVVDDEPDVEALFRQQFRREIREGLYTLDFALSAGAALAILDDTSGEEIILLVSDTTMAGMSGLDLISEMKNAAARPAGVHDLDLWRRRSAGARCRWVPHQAGRFPETETGHRGGDD